MSLGDYDRSTFAHGGTTRPVYRRGEGPAVVVMAEIPGIHPGVLEFADRVVDLGCTAVLPELFGRAGAPVTVGAALRSLAVGCVSREFVTWTTGRTSRVTEWLKALARHEHERCGGPGVGAVGMCFTGGFALAMMVEDSVVAPVLSQPSLPFPLSRRHRRDLGVSASDLARVKQRVTQGVEVLGLRFTCDAMAPGERFARLREELGDGFVGVEINSAPGNAHGIRKRAHSVLTEDLVDEPGHPTRDALDQVLDLFRKRLLAASTAR